MNFMHRLPHWLTHIAIPLIILAISVAGFLALGSRPQVKKKKRPEKAAELVKTDDILNQGPNLKITANGIVVPYRELQVAAEVGGTILKKGENFRAGKYIQKGDLVVAIDPRDFDLDVERQTKLRDRAITELERISIESDSLTELVALAQNTLALQTKEVSRVVSLLQRNAASEVDLSDAKRAEIAAKETLLKLQNQQRDLVARRTTLEQGRDLAIVQLKSAMLDRERAQITAPVSGIVIRDTVEERSHLTAGEPLGIIEDTAAAEVSCQLRMDDLYWIWSSNGQNAPNSIASNYELPALPVSIVYQLAGKKYYWKGQLARQDGFGLDPKSRTVPCRIAISEPRNVFTRDDAGNWITPQDGPRVLMRGMFVGIEIQCQPNRPLLRIPEIGLRPGGKIWLIRDQTLIEVEPKVVRIANSTAIIDPAGNDISTADRVIVSPVPNAKPGLSVRTAPPTNARTNGAAKTAEVQP